MANDKQDDVAPPSTSTSPPTVSAPPPISRPILSYRGNDFPMGSVGVFHLRSDHHDTSIVDEVSGRYVLSARRFEMNLTTYLRENRPKSRVHKPPLLDVRATHYTSSLIKAMIQAASSLFKRDLAPTDLSNPDNWLIFAQRPLSYSERFIIPDNEPIHSHLIEQVYNPIEVCILNVCSRDPSFGSEASHIEALKHLIFDKILTKDKFLEYGFRFDEEWRDLEYKLTELHETAEEDKDTEIYWKICEGHAVFMSWPERKGLIEKIYQWAYHTSGTYLRDLVIDAFSSGTLKNYVNTWINVVNTKQGSLLKIMNFRGAGKNPGKNPYVLGDVDHFIQFIRNFSTHVPDKDLNTRNNYKYIDINDPTEKFFVKESYVYLHFANCFPLVFVKLNEHLIKNKAPPG